MAFAEPWNARAARVLREAAYKPDGVEPAKGVLARDLAWWRFRLQVSGDSPERIEMAVRGLPLVVRTIGTQKYSPAKLCSKKGPWVNLFDLAVTAWGRTKAHRPDLPPKFREVFRAIANTL